VYSRLRLDISTRDFLYGIFACVWAWDHRTLTEDVVGACSRGGEAHICFSVRSGFDLLLQALALPTGSEVLVSAVTHPDMVRIIERHGLRAVPIDLDLVTLAPREELFERAASPRTRAILIAHLFGGRVNLNPIADFASEHQLLLFEDCAQAFHGPQYSGDPLADVSMFSFGPIKTATSLGGAVLYVRNRNILQKMRNRHSSWPVQRRREYLRKLLKFLFLAQAMRPTVYWLLFRTCKLLGKDFDTLVNNIARAFPPTGRPETQRRRSGSATKHALFEHIRRQPCAPLLALLAHRLRTFDSSRLARRGSVGEEISRRLPSSLMHPGRLANSHTHWLLPVISSDPDSLISALRRARFDAARATSNIGVVGAPPDYPGSTPMEAAWMMSHIVFLPVYPELTGEAIVRLIRTAGKSVGSGCPGDALAE
jgi:dTDP-4-amino-4,6-dideoxygalactose transaminase